MANWGTFLWLLGAEPGGDVERLTEQALSAHSQECGAGALSWAAACTPPRILDQEPHVIMVTVPPPGDTGRVLLPIRPPWCVEWQWGLFGYMFNGKKDFMSATQRRRHRQDRWLPAPRGVFTAPSPHSPQYGLRDSLSLLLGREPDPHKLSHVS